MGVVEETEIVLRLVDAMGGEIVVSKPEVGSVVDSSVTFLVEKGVTVSYVDISLFV